MAREGGVTALFRGSGALVVRGATLSAGQQLGYDGAKTYAKVPSAVAAGQTARRGAVARGGGGLERGAAARSATRDVSSGDA